MWNFIKDLFSNWGSIVAMVITLYEAIVRFIPTTKSLSLIGKLLAVLTWLSNNLDNIKK